MGHQPFLDQMLEGDNINYIFSPENDTIIGLVALLSDKDLKHDRLLTLSISANKEILSGDTQFHLGPLAVFCNHVALGSISISNFSANMSHLEVFPSVTFSYITFW